MKKQKEIFLMFGKLFLVFLMLFSQLFTPLEVLAEGINEGSSNEEIEPKSDEVPKTDTDEFDETTSEQKDTDTTITDVDTDQNKENETTTDETNEDNIDDEKTNDNEQTTDETVENNEQLDNTTTDEPISPQEGTTSPDTTDETTNTDDNTQNETTTDTESEYTYTIKINGEEKTEHTLSDEKTVNITQEYNGEEGTYHFSNDISTIDFTDKLYGDYTFNYSVLSNDDSVLDSKDVIIHYEGDNSEILFEYANEVDIYPDWLVLEGTNRSLTVEEILAHFDTEGLKNRFQADLTIQDGNGNTLSNTDAIDGNSALVLSDGVQECKFYIAIFGDYTNDNILNIDDSKAIIDYMIEEESDPEYEEGTGFSIYDATNSVFTTGVWDVTPETYDTLSNSLVNLTEVYRGEEFTVQYAIDGFQNNTLNGISGKINYNKEVLELVGVDSIGIYGKTYGEDKFAYLLDDYNSGETILTLRFKAIAVGEANISIDNIIATVLGNKANLGESISTTVTVLEAGKGGDVEETTTNQTTTPTTNTTPTVNTDSYYYPRQIVLSSDSLIKSLEIKGYKIDFDPHKYEYSIKVKNSVKSLDLTVILNDKNASYVVNGNENFKVGENVVTIVVTAEDGSTSTYTIKVNRKEKETEKAEEENNSSKPILIVLIVLVIAGLIYVIFKDDEEEQKK